jgi:hypothetical protein
MPAPDRPAYAVVGTGRWGTRIAAMLESTGRRVIAASALRRRAEEDDDVFVAAAADAFGRLEVDAAWLCVPPGPHVPALARAALVAGLHVVAEKPWNYGSIPTETIAAIAAERGRVVGVDFEYCLLDGVQRWRDNVLADDALTFGGRFVVAGDNRLGVSALDNLGSHLVAMQRYAVPQASIATIECAYGGTPERRVWLDRAGTRVAELDFRGNDEPILQRFVAAFEQAWSGTPFALDLAFATAVERVVRALEPPPT